MKCIKTHKYRTTRVLKKLALAHNSFESSGSGVQYLSSQLGCVSDAHRCGALAVVSVVPVAEWPLDLRAAKVVPDALGPVLAVVEGHVVLAIRRGVIASHHRSGPWVLGNAHVALVALVSSLSPPRQLNNSITREQYQDSHTLIASDRLCALTIISSATPPLPVNMPCDWQLCSDQPQSFSLKFLLLISLIWSKLLVIFGEETNVFSSFTKFSLFHTLHQKKMHECLLTVQ